MAGLQDFQQGSHSHRKTWINILLGILQLLLPCVQHGGAQLQALSQMSTSVVEVWQPEEADQFVPLQVGSGEQNDCLNYMGYVKWSITWMSFLYTAIVLVLSCLSRATAVSLKW